MRIFSNIEEFKDQTAIIYNGELTSYSALVALADFLTKDVRPEKSTVMFECTNDLNTIAAYVGLLRKGHSPILISDQGFSPDDMISTTFDPNYVWRSRQSKFETLSDTRHLINDELAVLLSTSGSTGSPKLVRLSHGNVLSNAESIASYLQFSRGERAISCLPLQYSYGMSVINAHLNSGNSVALTDLSISSGDFWDYFNEVAATNFQGVPYSFEMLAKSGFLNRHFPSLRHFTQAGGRLEPALVKQFAAFAKAHGSRFYVMYGQTEASPRISYVPPEDILDFSDTIGKAVPGGALRVEGENGPSEVGEPGELIYSGPNVMMGYAHSVLDLSRRHDTSELKTGDIAVKLPNGYFRITGRASRFIKLFGLRIGLDDIEERLSALNITAIATGDDRGLIVALLKGYDETRAKEFLENDVGLPHSAYQIVQFGEFPRLENGKIDFKTIKAAALAIGEVKKAVSLLSTAQAIFTNITIDGSESFLDLEGDSLNYVEFAMAIEGHLGDLPSNWERIPIRELDLMKASTTTASSFRPIPIDICLRAALTLLVLLHHATEWAFAGSAHALLAIAGYNFGRFQFPQLLKGHGIRVLRSLTLQVIVPYFGVLCVIFAFIGQIFWPQYLLTSNFFDTTSSVRRPTIYWFIESYILIILFLGLFFSIPLVSNFARKYVLTTVLSLFTFFMFVRLIAGYNPEFDLIGNAGFDIFNMNTPFMIANIFMFGWLVQALNSKGKKLLPLLALPLFFALPPGGLVITVPIFLSAMICLVAFNSAPIPRWISAVLPIIAASSLYIYMGQSFVFLMARKIIGEKSLAYPFVSIIGCLLFGIAAAKLIDRVMTISQGGLSRYTLTRQKSAAARAGRTGSSQT